MAMKLQVPPRYEPLLAKFLQMSTEEVTSLLGSLREEEPTLRIADLADSIADRLPLDRSKTRDVLRFLASLAIAREGLGMSVDEFVTELRSAMEASGKADLLPSDWDAFQASVADALSADTALTTSSKALDVMEDHERVYCYSRILTDLRPIFRSDVELAPAAVVATHTLKLIYHSQDSHQEFYVTLNRSDIDELIRLLERAKRKEESLKELLDKKDITFLGVKS